MRVTPPAAGGIFLCGNRRRPIGAKSDRPIGDPPACLNETEAAAWCEIVETSVPGLLTSADRVILEMTCRLLGRFRAGQIKGSEMRTLLSCLTHLGRTPAGGGRSRRSAEHIEEWRRPRWGNLPHPSRQSAASAKHR